jgi:hypothetical protein
MAWMTDTDDELTLQAAVLVQEHGDLDSAIAALLTQPMVDQLQVQRLKKRKLALKDQISKLHALLLPNIIA